MSAAAVASAAWLPCGTRARTLQPPAAAEAEVADRDRDSERLLALAARRRCRRPSLARPRSCSSSFSLPSTVDERLVAVDRLDVDVADRHLDRRARPAPACGSDAPPSQIARMVVGRRPRRDEPGEPLGRARARRARRRARPARGAARAGSTVSGPSGTPDGIVVDPVRARRAWRGREEHCGSFQLRP